jgi:hypothetical protein
MVIDEDELRSPARKDGGLRFYEREGGPLDVLVSTPKKDTEQQDEHHKAEHRNRARQHGRDHHAGCNAEAHRCGKGTHRPVCKLARAQ